MKNYNSTNTIILALHESSNDNVEVLLLHTRVDGSNEYIVGSRFEQKLYDGALGYEHMDYSWIWGHYFEDVVHTVDYWKRNVLGVDGPERFLCPDCSEMALEQTVELEYADGSWTCPKCGCTTRYPEEDICIRIEYEV